MTPWYFCAAWATPYTIILAVLAQTELCNYVFIWSIAHFEATHPLAHKLSVRDLLTFLLVVEMVYVLGPLGTAMSSPLWRHHFVTMSFDNESRWFLLACLYAKAFVVFGHRVSLRPIFQVALLLALQLFLVGDFAYCSFSYANPLSVIFLIQVPKTFLHQPWLPPSYCSSFLSNESNIFNVEMRWVLQYVLAFHYSIPVIKALTRVIERGRRFLPFGYVSRRLVVSLAGVGLFYTTCLLILAYTDYGGCPGWPQFHPGNNGNCSFVHWEAPAWVSRVEGCPNEHDQTLYPAELGSQNCTKGPTVHPTVQPIDGAVCVLTNFMAYALTVLLLGLAFVCMPWLHLKTAGRTTLGAFLVSVLALYKPKAIAAILDQITGRDLRSGVQQLDEELKSLGLPHVLDFALALLLMHTLAPLVQYAFVLPQSKLLTFLDRQAAAACACAGRSGVAQGAVAAILPVQACVSRWVRITEQGFSAAAARLNWYTQRKKAEAQSLVSSRKAADPTVSAV